MKKICVLIPAYNEQIVISSTIESILDSGFKSTDLFIVDDCSTDDTYSLAKQYTDNVLRLEKNLGKGCAIDAAIKKFNLLYKYDYVIMLDCDSLVGKLFKERVFGSVYRYLDVDLFVGQVKNSRSDNVISALRSVEYTFSHDIVKKGQDNFNVIYVSPGCASIYSTRVLKHLVFNSHTLAEDMDLTIQVHMLNRKIKYIHDIEVITQDPKTFTDYHKQIMRWFRGFWQIVEKYNILRFGMLSRVNLYMLYIILDTLITNRILMILMSMIFLPLQLVLTGILIDFVIFCLISIYAAVQTKRIDVILKIPIMYTLLFFNTYAFVRSFIEVIILRKKKFNWNKVKRYVGDKNEKHSVTDERALDSNTRAG